LLLLILAQEESAKKPLQEEAVALTAKN